MNFLKSTTSKQRKKIPNTPIEYSRVRPTWKNILTKKAIYKYTTTWNKNIRSLSGEFPVNKRRRSRAKLYKKYISKEFKKQNFKGPLFRGVTGKNKEYFESGKKYIKKPSFSSFTKKYSVALRFASAEPNGLVLVMKNAKGIPAINFRNYYKIKNEKEVLLPSGTFRINKMNKPFVYISWVGNNRA